MFDKSDVKFFSFVGVVLILILIFGIYAKGESDRLEAQLANEVVVVDINLSKPKTRIGDPCSDRNSLTENDLYIDTEGTCVGAKIIKK